MLGTGKDYLVPVPVMRHSSVPVRHYVVIGPLYVVIGPLYVVRVAGIYTGTGTYYLQGWNEVPS